MVSCFLADWKGDPCLPLIDFLVTPGSAEHQYWKPVITIRSLSIYNPLCLWLHDSDPVCIVHWAGLLPHQVTHTDNKLH